MLPKWLVILLTILAAWNLLAIPVTLVGGDFVWAGMEAVMCAACCRILYRDYRNSQGLL